MKHAKGNAAFVAGASSGLGRGIAGHLADLGWDVAVHFRSDTRRARSLVRRIEKKGRRACMVRADVTDRPQYRRALREALRAMGGIDVLVNTVGAFRILDVRNTTDRDWDGLMDGNFHGMRVACDILWPQMAERGWGRIINFGYAQIEQLGGLGDITPYAVAKTGVLMYSRALAKKLAGRGITVNVISPGIVENGKYTAQERGRLRRQIPAGRIGTIRDINHAIEFLIADGAAYITGSNIHVGGGWRL